MKKTAFYWIALLLLVSTTAFAQKNKGYIVELKIKGLKEREKCTLANYFGNGRFITDTARVDAKGKVTFELPDTLQKGIYMFILPGNRKFFDFPIHLDKKIVLEGDTMGTIVENLSVKQGDEAKRFVEYNQELGNLSKEVEKYREFLPKKAESKDSIKVYQDLVKPINEKIKKHIEGYTERNTNDILTYVLKVNKEVELPETPKLANGRDDSTFKYNYYKNHYWDAVNFSDARIVYTPIYDTKLTTFFDKVVFSVPDSIIKEADKLVAKAKANADMYKYTIHFITVHFEKSNIMGLEAVFAHMAEKYYMDKRNSPWVNEDQRKKIIKRAEDISPALIGKPAYKVWGFDTNMVRKDLYAVKAPYTVLYFWDSDCGHCQKTTPRLDSIYKKVLRPKNIEVYSMTLEHEDMKDWKRFIKKHNLEWINVHNPQTNEFKKFFDVYSTPVVYVLDADKKIIAKRIGVEQIEDFIDRHKKVQESLKKKGNK